MKDTVDGRVSDEVPPKFTQLLKDIESAEGELVRFECRVIGHPAPVVKWFCGRNQIENSPDFQVGLVLIYFQVEALPNTYL